MIRFDEQIGPERQLVAISLLNIMDRRGYMRESDDGRWVIAIYVCIILPSLRVI